MLMGKAWASMEGLRHLRHAFARLGCPHSKSFPYTLCKPTDFLSRIPTVGKVQHALQVLRVLLGVLALALAAVEPGRS